jgi:hypothetical protein
MVIEGKVAFSCGGLFTNRPDLKVTVFPVHRNFNFVVLAMFGRHIAKSWEPKEGWDWMYDEGETPLFFQSYETEIAAEEMYKLRKKTWNDAMPWNK